MDGGREGKGITRLRGLWTGGGGGGIARLGGLWTGGGGGGVLLGWEGCVKTIDIKCVSRYLCSRIVCWSSIVLAMLRS